MQDSSNFKISPLWFVLPPKGNHPASLRSVPPLTQEGFAQQIGEGTQKAQTLSSLCFLCPLCAFCGLFPLLLGKATQEGNSKPLRGSRTPGPRFPPGFFFHWRDRHDRTRRHTNHTLGGAAEKRPVQH